MRNDKSEWSYWTSYYRNHYESLLNIQHEQPWQGNN
jgi:hypothetical protein